MLPTRTPLNAWRIQALLIKALLGHALAGACLLAAGAHAELPDSVSQALLQQGVAPDSVSVVVQRVDAVTPLIRHHADKPLNPASTMKLLTTYAGLDILGPAYRWRTEVYADGPLQNGVLSGNLILKGHGDPSLMAEDLWRMLNSLRQNGVRDIRGDLVLDNSGFAPLQTDAGAFDNEPYRAYNATADALAVNLKSTSVKLTADGGQVTVSIDPQLPEIRVSNQLSLVSKACGDWKNQLHYEIQNQGNAIMPAVLLTLTGEFSALCGEKYLDLSLLSSRDYTHALFRKLWTELGGSIRGQTRLAATPASATKLLHQDSLPLADVVRRINKYSNNFMARQLLLTLGAEGGAVPASERDGEQVVRRWLEGKHLQFAELVLENGAGLSRIERISAQHLNDILVSAYASPVMPELMSSLPVLSSDGTTAQRLKSSPASGRAHLKTGSLEGVRSIAGYMLDQNGQRWSVVFMANLPNVAVTRNAQDALLEWVYSQAGSANGSQAGRKTATNN